MNLNTIAEEDGNWAQAEADLSCVIHLEPTLAAAYFHRGNNWNAPPPVSVGTLSNDSRFPHQGLSQPHP